MTVSYLDAKRITGLSTDTKPTNVETNSIFVETDTPARYMYDGTSWNVVGYHYRYWKYEMYATSDHHPMTSRIYLIKSDNTRTNFAYYTTDNCSDSGSILGTSSPIIPSSLTIDLGSKQFGKGFGFYTSFWGSRNASIKIYGSHNNSTWVELDDETITTTSGCGEYNRYF